MIDLEAAKLLRNLEATDVSWNRCRLLEILDERTFTLKDKLFFTDWSEKSVENMKKEVGLIKEMYKFIDNIPAPISEAQFISLMNQKEREIFGFDEILENVI